MATASAAAAPAENPAAVAAAPVGVGRVTAPPERVAFRIHDDRVTESSGLALSVRHPHTVWTVNDSGDSARVFAVDTRTGRTVGVHTFGAPVRDVEALALTPGGRVLVADIGDNAGSREVVRLFWFDEPGLGRTSGGWASWELSYPDGPHNAEALAVDPTSGRVFVVTKERPGGVYALPAAPSRAGVNRLTRVGTAPDIVTDAVFLPDGSGLAVRTYTSLVVLDPSTWRVQSSQLLPPQPQGETLAVAPGGTGLLVGSEGKRSIVQEVDLSPGGRARSVPPSAPTPTPPPPPLTPPPQPPPPTPPTPAAPEPRGADDPRSGSTSADAHQVTLGAAGAIGLVVLALLVTRRARRHRR
jgi:hypothetical protein